MSEMREVKQERKHVTTPPDLEEKYEGTKCTWVNTKGRRIGETCGKFCAEGQTFCAAHITLLLRDSRNDQPVKAMPTKASSSFDRDYHELYEPDLEEDSDPEVNDEKIIRPERNISDRDEIIFILKNITVILAHLTLK